MRKKNIKQKGDDKSLPIDLFSGDTQKSNKENKKKTLANIYEELFWKKDKSNDLTEQLLGLREGFKTFRQIIADPASEKMRHLPFPTEKEIKYVDTLYKEEIAYLEALIDRQTLTSNIFQPKKGLEEVVHKDYVNQFGEIEKELMQNGFLNENYNWLPQKKKTFCEFLVVILKFGYTAKQISDTNVRYFFEKRYGKPRLYLSKMFRISKRPSFEDAIISFSFILKPQEKKEIDKEKKKQFKL